MNDESRDDGQQDGTGQPHLLIHGSEETGIQHVVASSLAEAVAYAEYLANQRDDDTSRIFEMRELDISFKTYFQVELVRNQIEPMPPREPHLVVGIGSTPRVVPIPA